MAIPLAASMALPPPRPTMTSAPCRMYSRAPCFDLEILRVGGDLVEIDESQPRLEQAVHGLVHPSGLEEPLVADQKNLLPAQAPGTGADLVEKAAAENDLRDLEFAVVDRPVGSRIRFCSFSGFQPTDESRVRSDRRRKHCFSDINIYSNTYARQVKHSFKKRPLTPARPHCENSPRCGSTSPKPMLLRAP